MSFPTSEVGYTPAMPRREEHEVHKGHVVALGGGMWTVRSILVLKHGKQTVRTHFLTNPRNKAKCSKESVFLYHDKYLPPRSSSDSKKDRLDLPRCCCILWSKMEFHWRLWRGSHGYKRYWCTISDSIDITKGVGVAGRLQPSPRKAKFKTTGCVRMTVSSF